MNIATGVFTSVQQAEEAWRALNDAGFSSDHIGLAVCDQSKAQMLASDLKRDFRSDATPSGVFDDRAVYCRLSDNFVDTVRSSNLPDEAVDWYQMHLKQGDILEIVDVGDRMDDADRIIRDHGGMLYLDQQGRTGAEMQGTRDMRETARTESPDTVYVPLIEEEVSVEKVQRNVGEVEISTEFSRETVDLPTTITHEEIRVERHRLDQPLSVDEYKNRASTEPGIIRMPVIEEEVRVVKRPIIREEMVVTRVPVTERQTLHETVQHTEPHIETHGKVKVEDTTTEGKKRRPAA